MKADHYVGFYKLFILWWQQGSSYSLLSEHLAGYSVLVSWGFFFMYSTLHLTLHPKMPVPTWHLVLFLY
jgi:hypothetical protein